MIYKLCIVKDKYVMPHSQYKATIKVYDEWNNLTGNIHNSNSASGKSYYISDDGKSLNCQKDKDFFIKAYTKNK